MSGLNWVWRHYQYMSWSYVGLLAGTSNEAFVRIPAFIRFTASTTHWLPLLGTAVIVSLSAWVIFSQQRRVLGQQQGTPAS